MDVSGVKELLIGRISIFLADRFCSADALPRMGEGILKLFKIRFGKAREFRVVESEPGAEEVGRQVADRLKKLREASSEDLGG